MKKIALIFTLVISTFSMFAKDVFRLNPITDGIIGGTGVLIYGTDLVLDKGLKLNQPVFDGNLLNLDDVNSFDRTFAKPYNRTIDKTSDVLLASSFLLPAVLLTTEKDEWLTVGVMYAETMLLAQGIKETIKFSVFRPRPYAYFDGWPEKDVLQDYDWANSFLSGHSTMTFAAATFTTYTFCKYFPESNWRFAVAGGSYALAATVALMRMAGGCHFATDVICGAVLGTACGFLVPWLHTLGSENDDKAPLISVAPNGFQVTLKL